MIKTILTICVLSTSVIFGQTTKPENTEQSKHTVEQSKANIISQEILSHIKEIFMNSTTAKDKASAKTAITNMEQSAKKILSLKAQLETTRKPTAEEKQKFAIEMVKFEAEISDLYKAMFKTFENNTEEINELLEPAISMIKLEIAPALETINQYYPSEEMFGYIQAAKSVKSTTDSN